MPNQKPRKKRQNVLAEDDSESSLPDLLNSLEKEGGRPAKSNETKKKKNYGSKGLSGDIFNDAAMENAYYTCHNVQDVLKSRGFPWPDGQKKKKKGKR